MAWPAIAAAATQGVGVGSKIITSAMNVHEQRKNRRFQRDMSNTAHQREMADLKKAGLNPLLTGKYGGASTPAGSVGQIQSPFEGVPEQVTSAIAMRKQLQVADAGIKTQESVQNVNSATALKIQAEEEAIRADNARRENKFPLELDKLINESDNLIQSIHTGKTASASNVVQARRMEAEIKKFREELKKLKVSGRFWENANKLLNKLSAPAQDIVRKTNWFQKIYNNMSQYHNKFFKDMK